MGLIVRAAADRGPAGRLGIGPLDAGRCIAARTRPGRRPPVADARPAAEPMPEAPTSRPRSSPRPSPNPRRSSRHRRRSGPTTRASSSSSPRARAAARPDRSGLLDGRAGRGPRDRAGRLREADRRRARRPSRRRSRRATGVAAEVVVEGSADRPWDFGTDIVPIFTVAGCNTGGCHGKADGQNGFHLSLFGYDPDGDHRRPDPRGRRPSALAARARTRASCSARRPAGSRTAAAGSWRPTRTPTGPSAPGSPTAPPEPGRGPRRGSSRVEVRPGDVRLDEPGPAAAPGRRPLRRRPRARRDPAGPLRRQRRLGRHGRRRRGRAELLRRAETDLIVRYQTDGRRRPAGDADQPGPRLRLRRARRGTISSMSTCSSGSTP